MNVTIKEALIMQCPFGKLCVATKCMAWRWVKVTLDSGDPRGLCGLVVIPPITDHPVA